MPSILEYSLYPRHQFVHFAGMALAMIALGSGAASTAALGSERDEFASIGYAGIDPLVTSPGVSRSVVAGTINPAAWPIQGQGGFYLGWDRPSDRTLDMFQGTVSFENLGFSVRNTQGRDGLPDHYDYTLGVGGGNRSGAVGVSYAWTRGGESTYGKSSRIGLGFLHRSRPVSIGLSRVWERAAGENVYQGDLGIRPFGPRVTLFADAHNYDNRKFSELDYAFGADIAATAGVNLAARYEDGGSFDEGRVSLRVDLSIFPGSMLSYRHHLDQDSDTKASTYAMEFRRTPSLIGSMDAPIFFPEVRLGGPLTYRTFRFFDQRQRLIQVLAALDYYASQPTVGGVVVNLSGFRATPASIWEVRAQLAALRAEGKLVVVYIDRGNMYNYVLASVADELWIDPIGDLDIRGVSFGRTYYKRALDKVGVTFDEWRFFTYKSAMESFSRESMSEPDREQLTAIMNDFYDESARLVLEARGLAPADWDAIVNEKGRLTPTEAVESGLADKIGSYEEARASVYQAKRRSTSDLSYSSAGKMFGDPVWEVEEWAEPPEIAVLYAIGPTEMRAGIRGTELAKSIRKMRDDRRVKAIVLRADSPGGDPLASDLVSREIKAAKKVKPVIVSQGQLAASGGYWISMHGTEIFASPYTITGSIGVIYGHYYDSGFGEKYGLDYEGIKRGSAADMMAGPQIPLIGVRIPSRPVTDAERSRGERIIKNLYQGFVSEVAIGRGMDTDEVDDVGQGRVWSGLDGRENGLVDEIGGLWDAILRAKELAGIADDDPVQIVQGPELGFFNPDAVTPLRRPLMHGRGWQLSSPFSGGLLPRSPQVQDLHFDGRQMNEATAGTGSASSSGDVPTGSGVLQGPYWGLLSAAERAYLELMLTNPGRPMTMMPPIGIEGVDGNWILQ